MSRYRARSAAFAITLLGLIINLIVTAQVFAAARSLRWEPEFEWEASGDNWRVDGIKVIWGLLFAYFAAAAVVCGMGFIGVVKSKASLVRFYRDYSIADLVFCFCSIVAGSYYAFRTTTQEGVCEELSHQPELMRELTDTGLSPENCERWFERAVMVFVAVMFVVNVARLHFLLAVANYYSHMSRFASLNSPTHTHCRTKSQDSLQRIYLLPRNSISASEPLVYAPVPLSQLETSSDWKHIAAETWVTSPHSHRHRDSMTGRICLPIKHDEALLPSYTQEKV